MYTIALICDIDTAVIEAKNAAIRRDVISRVHGHALKVSRASCAFVLRAVTLLRMIADGGMPASVSVAQEMSSLTEKEEASA